MTKYNGVIFDLDGVLVDTAKYHFLAWRALAERLKINFREQDNEGLKGVSRQESLELLLSLGTDTYSEAEKESFMEEKNQRYLGYISQMTETEILPGVLVLLKKLKQQGIKIALGSASKNAETILTNTKIKNYFDAIVDGNQVSQSKPDPEVFLLGAEKLHLVPSQCIVFEDAAAGIVAAKKAGMLAIGVGQKENLGQADYVVGDLTEKDLTELLNQLLENKETFE